MDSSLSKSQNSSSEKEFEELEEEEEDDEEEYEEEELHQKTPLELDLQPQFCADNCSLEIHLKKTTELKFDLRITAPKIRVSFCDTQANNGDSLHEFVSEEGFIASSKSFSFAWTSTVKITPSQLELLLSNDKYAMFLEIFQEKGEKQEIPVCWAFVHPLAESAVRQRTEMNLQLHKYRRGKTKAFDQWKNSELKTYPAFLKIVWEFIAIAEEVKKQPTPSSLHLSAAEARNVHWEKNLPMSTFAFHHFKDLIAFTDTSSAYAMASIQIAEICSFRTRFVLKGHEDKVEQLEWRARSSGRFVFGDDEGDLLLSVSDDKTCIVWEVGRKAFSMKFVLPHSSFMTTASFLHSDMKNHTKMQIATGGADGSLRIWTQDQTDTIKISQDFPNDHSSFIIPKIAVLSAKTFFSAEFKGVVVEWKCDGGKWRHLRKILKTATPIRQIDVHRAHKQLFVLTNDSIEVVDISSGRKMPSVARSLQKVGRFCISESRLFAALINGGLVCCDLKSKAVTFLSEAIDVVAIDFHTKFGLLGVASCRKGVGMLRVLSLEGAERQEEKENELKTAEGRKLELRKDKSGRNEFFESVLCELDAFFGLEGSKSISFDTDERKNDETFDVFTDEEEPSRRGSRTFSVSSN